MPEDIGTTQLAELYRVMDQLVRHGGIGEISQEAKMLAVETAETVLGLSDDEVMETALEMDAGIDDKRLRHEIVVNGTLRPAYEARLVDPPVELKTEEEIVAFARDDLRVQVAGRLFRSIYSPDIDTTAGYKMLRNDDRSFNAGSELITRMVSEYLGRSAF